MAASQGSALGNRTSRGAGAPFFAWLLGWHLVSTSTRQFNNRLAYSAIEMFPTQPTDYCTTVYPYICVRAASMGYRQPSSTRYAEHGQGHSASRLSAQEVPMAWLHCLRVWLSPSDDDGIDDLHSHPNLTAASPARVTELACLHMDDRPHRLHSS